MQGGLAARVARGQDLEDVELGAAARPAGAVGLAVLQGARDLRVQDPRCGHVHVPAGGAVIGHHEFHEEGLVGASEAVYFTIVSQEQGKSTG